MVNTLFLLTLLEDLSLSAKLYPFKVDRVLCEAQYCTLKHAQPDFAVSTSLIRLRNSQKWNAFAEKKAHSSKKKAATELNGARESCV